MDSKINETECCVCFESGIRYKCKTCVGSLCHDCYCELEYSECYSLVDCPMCRTPMITDFINVRFIDIIQDWNLRGKEDDLPVVKLLFKNVNPDSDNLCHTCNNWEDKCVCEECIIRCGKCYKSEDPEIPYDYDEDSGFHLCLDCCKK